MNDDFELFVTSFLFRPYLYLGTKLRKDRTVSIKFCTCLSTFPKCNIAGDVFALQFSNKLLEHLYVTMRFIGLFFPDTNTRFIDTWEYHSKGKTTDHNFIIIFIQQLL